MRADKYAVKTIDVSYLNNAVQLFNTQEGRLPKDLNELVPNYVGKLPATPYGTKLDYDPNTGQVKVVQAVNFASHSRKLPKTASQNRLGAS